MVLRSYNEYLAVVHINISDWQIVNIKESILEEDIEEINGTYSNHTDSFFAMFIYKDEICISINKLVIKFREINQITIETKGNLTSVKILLHNMNVIEVKEHVKFETFINDFTPFIDEEEDRSYLVLFYNIFQNKERQNIMKEVWLRE